MKLKIIISIITGIAILQCVNTDTPVESDSDHTLQNKIKVRLNIKMENLTIWEMHWICPLQIMLRPPGIFFSPEIIEHRTQSCRSNR